MNRRVFLVGGASALILSQAGWVLADDTCRVTGADIEGPFFRARAPFRGAIAPEEATRPLVLEGVVRDTHCRPLRDAVLEFWQADPEGEYDNVGYGFRGRLRTDDSGRYRLLSAVPGRYLNGPTYRPRHIHIKVHANGHPSLTTQAYFPDDPYNDSDPWFRSARVIHVRPPGCHPNPTTRGSFDITV